MSKLLEKNILITQECPLPNGKGYIRVIHETVRGCSKEELKENEIKLRNRYNDRSVGASSFSGSGRKVSGKGVSYSS